MGRGPSGPVGLSDISGVLLAAVVDASGLVA
jgi:hypothetical protein